MIDCDPVVLVDVVRRLLRVGVPPTAIANAFDIDPEPIGDVAVEMRRESYGTAELSEAMSFLTWKAYEKALRMIEQGSPDIQLKATMQFLSKSLATSARNTPEEVQRARADFARFVQDVEIAEEGYEDQQAQYAALRGEYVETDYGGDE